jgi:hypothetical protein
MSIGFTSLLRALQEADIKKWWPLIKEFGVKAE